MKLWLDDLRKPPFGFVWVKTVESAILALQAGGVEHLDLDHDLCEAHYAGLPSDVPTGYAVVEWMIEHHVWPASIAVHSLSPSGAARMKHALLKHVPSGTMINRTKPEEP